MVYWCGDLACVDNKERKEYFFGTVCKNRVEMMVGRDFKLDEQLIDTESDKQSSEKIIQKNNKNIYNKEYAVFTNEFDEIAKAETLETQEEISKLRKNLDQQLVSFQDLILKLANKLQ